MAQSPHYVAGLFEGLGPAQRTRTQLAKNGLLANRCQIFSEPLSHDQPGSRTALRSMLVDGAIGGAIGIGLGAITELVLVVADIRLFMASPLLAPLVLMGWGATIGGTLGALVGTKDKSDPPLSDVIRDAVSVGQTVLMVETHSRQEARTAHQLMQEAEGRVKEVIHD